MGWEAFSLILLMDKMAEKGKFLLSAFGRIHQCVHLGLLPSVWRHFYVTDSSSSIEPVLSSTLVSSCECGHLDLPRNWSVCSSLSKPSILVMLSPRGAFLGRHLYKTLCLTLEFQHLSFRRVQVLPSAYFSS